MYCYVHCNPITSFDPLGLFSWKGLARGIWDVVTEPIKAASDVFILTPAIAVHNLVSDNDIYLDDIEYSSALSKGTQQRILSGEDRGTAAVEGYKDLGEAVVTLGVKPMAENMGTAVGEYEAGSITYEEMDYRISRAAGNGVGAAAMGSAVSKAGGNGWTGRTTLYRGVNEGHAFYEEAQQGIVRPNGGNATPFEHNTVSGATQRSPYSSWSTDPAVAENFALRGGGQGVVIRARVPSSRTTVTKNNYQIQLKQSGEIVSESEVLVKGTVQGSVRTVNP